MNKQTRYLGYLYWAATLAAFGAMTALLVTYTPTEASMGPIQKIFYLHLPAAINTFVACLIVFVASIGYLWQRKTWWDDLALAAARVSVLLCSVVLLTGIVWARGSWGTWWTWSPRLTFSLVLWLLYVVYLMTRTSIESPQRRAMVSAVYGIAAFLDVPLVYVSVRLMPDIHPSSVSLAPAMRLTLGLWFIPVTLLTAGLIVSGFRLNRRTRTAAPVPRPNPARRLPVAGARLGGIP
jgi:heme exporter protein C